MSEAFLHYVWKHQYFDKTSLTTSGNESLLVFKPGFHNTDSGPDFQEASIQLDTIRWNGHVEIHLRSSDWQAHRHHEDEAYNNTILHVVWLHDQDILRKDGTPIPTLELKNRIDEKLREKYELLIRNNETIPCASQLKGVEPITLLSVLDKTVVERLRRKSEEVKELFSRNHNDWEETAYQLLARSYGFKKNNDSFSQLARNLPYKIIKKHNDNSRQQEALLYGQAGFLTELSTDPYHQLLYKEYVFLAKKYTLSDPIPLHQWKFLRLRPANFPTVRLAQFAAFLSTSQGLFNTFIESPVNVIANLLQHPVSTYWQTHYRFGKPSARRLASLGQSSAQNLCINTIAPILVAYGEYMDEPMFVDKATELLQSLEVERNNITDKMKVAGFDLSNAFDSQALIELHNEYCLKKKCLRCAIGSALVRP